MEICTDFLWRFACLGTLAIWCNRVNSIQNKKLLFIYFHIFLSFYYHWKFLWNKIFKKRVLCLLFFIEALFIRKMIQFIWNVSSRNIAHSFFLPVYQITLGLSTQWYKQKYIFRFIFCLLFLQFRSRLDTKHKSFGDKHVHVHSFVSEQQKNTHTQTR